MPIKDATSAEIEAMQNRLKGRQADRIAEIQMQEALDIVHRKNHPFVTAPVTEHRTKAAVNTVAMLMIASSGALLWNIADSRFGLLMCLVASLMALRPAKK